MSHKISRNEPCPCGSGRKYKKCCLQYREMQSVGGQQWMDQEGIHIVGKGRHPSPEEQKRMTKEYQKNIKKGPIWEMMIKEYGVEKAEEMLKEFQVQIK